MANFQVPFDELVTFTAQIHDPASLVDADADSAPSYRIYEDTTDTPILTGNFSKLDDANTLGLYRAQIQCSAANGFELAKSYTIRKSATVGALLYSTAVDTIHIIDPITLGSFFTANSGKVYADAIAGSVVREIVNGVMSRIKILRATAISNYPFTIYLTGSKTPATGRTITCTRLLDADAAFSAMSNSAVEVGVTGTYRINITAADTTATTGTWKFTPSGTGADTLIQHFITQS